MTNDDPSGFLGCVCGDAAQDGPCDTAAGVYRRALVEGSVPAAEVPACLRALRLVVADRDAPHLMNPVPPETASFAALGPLEESIERGRRNLLATRSALAAFEELYADVFRIEQPVLTRLAGSAVIGQALEAAVAGCREEALTMQPGAARPARTLRESLPRDLQLLGRGVRRRTLYQHAVRSDPDTLSYIEDVTAAGAEVRTLAEVADRVLVFDRNIGFIRLSEDFESALRIEHPALVGFLVRYFDSFWARGLPVRPAAGPGRTPVITSDLQRTILLAVVNGETDDAIARRIGMSRRSVAEHMRKVSERLGSNSRAQLGYLLATSGLLD